MVLSSVELVKLDTVELDSLDVLILMNAMQLQLHALL